MFEFRWSIDGPSGQHLVRLQIHSSRGWLGRKVILLDNRILVRRRWFGGINYSFPHPDEPGKKIRIKAVRKPETNEWLPELTCAGQPVAEITGTQAPYVPNRTRSVAIVTGLAYLTMLMSLVMLPHIWRMLNANFGHSDSRAFVIAVDNPHTGGPIFEPQSLPQATVGTSYHAEINVRDTTAEHTLTRSEGRLPPGLEFDPNTQVISGTPTESGDTIIGFSSVDENGRKTKWCYAVSVTSDNEPSPRIATESLPRAELDGEYSASMTVSGGQPPYDWVINKRKLPKGLKLEFDEDDLNHEELTIIGTPTYSYKCPECGETITASQAKDISEKTGSSHKEHPRTKVYPIRFRVFDSTYSPAQHVLPWIVPFLTTSICLLGFWNMRAWSVVFYGVLILGQVILFGVLKEMGNQTVDDWSFSMVACAVVLQVLVFAAGAVNYKRMQ